MLKTIPTQKTHGGARRPLSGLLGAGDEDEGGGGVALRPVAGAAEQHRPNEEGGRRRPLRQNIRTTIVGQRVSSLDSTAYIFCHLINAKAAKTE